MDKATSERLFNYLDNCCQAIAARQGDKAINEWTNSDYIRLCADLYRTTNVSISANTLKRIFGKLKTPERYYPQRATRDALALYAGFKNWEQLEETFQENEETSIAQPVPAAAPLLVSQAAPSAIKQRTSKPRLWGWGLLLIALAGTLFYTSPGKSPVKAKLVCSNPNGKTPHSAVFSIALPEGVTTNMPLLIDFGDGERPKPITPGAQLSHYYKIPGRYYAVLKSGDRALDTSVVYLQTNGWTATARTPRDTIWVYPIDTGILRAANALFVTTPQLYRAGIDTSHTFFIDFVNTTAFPVDADNFELSVRLKTSDDRPGVRCSPLYVNVYGERTSHYFNIHRSGCEAWIEAGFSEWAAHSTSEDIKAFTADLSNGGKFTLRVAHKNITFFINDKALFTTSYKIPVGNIYGLRFSFAGIGAVYEATLKDLLKDTTLPLFTGRKQE
ncbi:hypothetical protein [Niabella beijingensis]|uniref:hypothetical protein n=1 Tax=Niabella beijingensis TaxID=2872700 RepID=UPI001CBC7FFC|nr:hypothetical protein [Niabella beijingensis]MBZ4192173.1 hypothetical protein [Niabella beijingensis]